MQEEQFIFEIISENANKNYYFACSSEIELDNWIKKLKNFVKSNEKNSSKETIIMKRFKLPK